MWNSWIRSNECKYNEHRLPKKFQLHVFIIKMIKTNRSCHRQQWRPQWLVLGPRMASGSNYCRPRLLEALRTLCPGAASELPHLRTVVGSSNEGPESAVRPTQCPWERGISPEKPQVEEAEWVGEDGLSLGARGEWVSEHLVSGLGDLLFLLCP